jgi:hypothetical protein
MLDMTNVQHLWPVAQLMELQDVLIELVQMPQQLIILMIYVRLIIQLEIVLQRMEEDAELIQLVKLLILIQPVWSMELEKLVSGMEHVRLKLVQILLLLIILMPCVQPF